MPSWFKRHTDPSNLKGDALTRLHQPAPRLPLELMHLIIEFSLPPPRLGARGRARASLLAGYCLVSRDWRAFSQDELFRHLVISTGTQCSKLAEVCCPTTVRGGSPAQKSKTKAKNKFWRKKDEKGRHVELAEMVRTVRIGSILPVYSAMLSVNLQQLGDWSPAVVPLLQSFTNMEELRMSEVYHCKLQLEDLSNAKALHTLFLRYTRCNITQTSHLPNLRYVGIQDSCLHSSLAEELAYGYDEPSRARYHLLLNGIAPNLSIYANFPGCSCIFPRSYPGYEPELENANSVTLSTAKGTNTSEEVVVVREPNRLFEWSDGEVSNSRIGWFVLPSSMIKIELVAKSVWTRFTIICFKVGNYRSYPTMIKTLADVLDDLLPLWYDQPGPSSGLINLREIRIPTFEDMGVPDREVTLKDQMQEVDNLRKVCGRGARRVRVVVDDSLADGEYANSNDMEEGAFHQSFWNGVRSLQSLQHV